MNEATTKIIEELSSKLGTTAEHLWGVLVKQAPISGACDSLFIIVLILALVWASRFIRRKCVPDKDGYSQWSDCLPAWAVWFVCAAIVTIVIGGCLSGIVSAFANPEYWALMQIMPN